MITPTDDRVAIRPTPPEQMTHFGLHLPEQAQNPGQEGVILAIGPGRYVKGKRIPMDVKVGDRVLYSKYGSTEVEYDHEPLVIAAAQDLLVVFP